MSIERIKTVSGEWFEAEESAQLAFLIWKRWGRDLPAAAAAWRRLMQNSTTDAQFEALVEAASR